MKTHVRNLLLGSLAIAGVAGPVLAHVAHQVTPLATVAAATAQAVVHIPTMTCTNRSCETTVYLSLMRVPGVSNIRINEGAQDVLVQYDPAKASTEVLLATLRNAGYPGSLVLPRKS